MKLGEQWEIEMPGFGKMTVGSQTNNNNNKTQSITNMNNLKRKQTQIQTKLSSGRLRYLDLERVSISALIFNTVTFCTI